MTRHVAVIGAGITGATTALELLRDGHRVTIVEPAAPGGEQAASYGNAGWFSSMSVIPPSGPGLWRQVPGFVMDPLGPLAIRWSYLPKALPWLLRYLAAGWTEARVLRIAQALRPLLQESPVLHAALAAEAGVPDLVEHRGLINAYTSRKAFEGEAMGWRIRRQVGIAWTELEGAALREAEPDLDPSYTFAVLIEEAGRCLDPGAYVAALVALAQSRGAVLRAASATGFRIEGGRLPPPRAGRGLSGVTGGCALASSSSKGSASSASPAAPQPGPQDHAGSSSCAGQQSSSAVGSKSASPSIASSASISRSISASRRQRSSPGVGRGRGGGAVTGTVAGTRARRRRGMPAASPMCSCCCMVVSLVWLSTAIAGSGPAAGGWKHASETCREAFSRRGHDPSRPGHNLSPPAIVAEARRCPPRHTHSLPSPPSVGRDMRQPPRQGPLPTLVRVSTPTDTLQRHIPRRQELHGGCRARCLPRRASAPS